MYWFHWSEWVLDCITLILVGVTSALAWFTFKLWASSEITSKKQLRAYIGVDEQPDPQNRKEDYLILDGKSAYQFVSFVKNYGNTPANKIMHAASIKYCSEKPTEEWFDSLKPIPCGMLQPSQHSYMPYIMFISQADWSVISSGAKKKQGWALYIYGRVNYSDIFGRVHFTRYCFKIDFRKGQSGIPAWDLYPSFNDSDMDVVGVAE